MQSNNIISYYSQILLRPFIFSLAPPRITSLVFTPGLPLSTLTCISTDSPATTVTWMRDGQPLVVDGSTYQLSQCVISRTQSTYENVLTINMSLLNIITHKYICSVANVLGTATKELELTGNYIEFCQHHHFAGVSVA